MLWPLLLLPTNNPCFLVLVTATHARRTELTTDQTAALLARRNGCGRVYMRSPRIRCSESTHTYSVKSVTIMHANTLDADIMNMIIICRRAAGSTSAPPKIAPVIVPGMEIMPITLQFMEKGSK
jgi:hypothetical protein